jgi:hypothetical protein
MAITLISTVTVPAGGQASIDFTSIPGTYTDLMVVVSMRLNAVSTGNFQMIVNGDTSSGVQSHRTLEGNGASPQSLNGSGVVYFAYLGKVPGTDTTASTFSNATIYIPNYAGSLNKPILVDNVTENNGTTAWQGIFAGLRSDTTAITSLSVRAQGNTLAQYSTASLYGVLKGSSGGVTVA